MTGRVLDGDTSSRYVVVPYHVYNRESGAWKLNASLY